MSRGLKLLLAALVVLLLPVTAYAVGSLGPGTDPPRPRQDIVIDDSGARGATSASPTPDARTVESRREARREARQERRERQERAERQRERAQQQERAERQPDVRVVTPAPAPVDDDDDGGDDRDDDGGDGDDDDGGDDDGDDD